MPESIASQAQLRSTAAPSLVATSLFGLALLLTFHATTWSMVSIWLRSETFAHGFLILPISLWLVWNEWDRLRGISATPAPWVALLMIFPGFAWLLAWLVDVLVVQQLALVGMLVIGAWAILGHQLARALGFPLLFLFFAVPMGEALVSPMMEFTATSTVWLIQQTGIPVYREGLYFTLPSGNWSVVEACSGVRYIIASITLGVLYAYLTYRSLWRRALFVLVSAIVPVFANTLRAYIIVMLGHMSDMTIATGVDHLVYGWVFFGLVIFVLFWLGSFWREDRIDKAGDQVAVSSQVASIVTNSRLLSVVVTTLVAAAVWPLLAWQVSSASSYTSEATLAVPRPQMPWVALPEPAWNWQPVDPGADRSVSGFYQGGAAPVALYIQQYLEQASGVEMISSKPRLVEEEFPWRIAGQSSVAVDLAGNLVTVGQAQLSGPSGSLTVWSWYRIGKHHTGNAYAAKAFEAMNRLTWGRPDTARIIVATPSANNGESRRALQDFLAAHLPAIEQALDEVAAVDAGR